jgi:hypothetical protein
MQVSRLFHASGMGIWIEAPARPWLEGRFISQVIDLKYFMEALAVNCEPVSGAKFPLTGKIQGIYQPERHRYSILASIYWRVSLFGTILSLSEQGIFRPVTGNQFP